MSYRNNPYYSLEGDCPECTHNPLVWVTPDGLEIRLCNKDSKIIGARKAGWRLKIELLDTGEDF